MVGHHKGGVEAHAELTDDVDVLPLLLLSQVLFEMCIRDSYKTG